MTVTDVRNGFRVTQPAPGDVIEVAYEADAFAFRMRVACIDEPLPGFQIAQGQEVNLHGHPIRPRSFPLYTRVEYVVVPNRWGRWFREALLGRPGRHRP